MNTRQTRSTICHSRRGAMLVLIAVCLPLCVIMAAFAVDVAWMQLARTELRTATDAAARAGSKALSLHQDRNAALAAAKEAALRNKVAGEPLKLANQDIEIGLSQRPDNGGRFQFTAGGSKPNAVRVTGRRTRGSAAGAVDLLFAGVLGVEQFEPTEVATGSQMDRDICLVIDRSGSMMQSAFGRSSSTSSSDCNPPNSRSRWAALDAGVNVFLDEMDRSLPDEQVGMVSYGSDLRRCNIDYPETRLESDLVRNYSPLRAAMARIGSRPVQGATHIGEGIIEGTKVLTGRRARAFSFKTMILMTDGIQNGGSSPVQAARQAARRDIVIHTITFSDEADQRAMRDVALATGGRHFHASDPQELIDVFREIAATLPILTTE